jgi:NADH dehydrogenase FAD-containing subunit
MNIIQRTFPPRAGINRTSLFCAVANVRQFSSEKGKANSSDGRPKVVIVGAGWAGYRMAYDLDKTKFDVKVVSPRNHFLFTPLLASTTVGTLEFRAIQEPVRIIPNLHYYQAEVTSINFEKNTVHCSDIFKHKFDFDLDYDALILAPGAETNTFGVKGIAGNDKVFFLKQLSHSRAIRNRLIDCFERASSPGVTLEEKRRLLTFIIVGGGPTSIEFAAELYDFLTEDISRWYEDLLPYTCVKIVELTEHILGAFSSSLVSYTEKLFQSRQNIHLITGTGVKEVKDNIAVLSNGNEIPFGMMVWSTGIKQVPFVTSLPKETVAKFPNGRLQVDDYLHLLATTNQSSTSSSSPSTATISTPVGQGRVFAMGDCAGNNEKPLPALAQVAGQQGKYLAKIMNKHGLESLVQAKQTASSNGAVPIFKYAHLGSLASVGQWKGVFDSPHLGKNRQIKLSVLRLLSFNFISSLSSLVVDRLDRDPPPVSGTVAFLLWRSAYWTKSVSISNKMLILMYWFKAWVFGRDISRF